MHMGPMAMADAGRDARTARWPRCRCAMALSIVHYRDKLLRLYVSPVPPAPRAAPARASTIILIILEMSFWLVLLIVVYAKFAIRVDRTTLTFFLISRDFAGGNSQY